MNSGLKHASQSYRAAEIRTDVTEACWKLIVLMWKLNIISYDNSDYSHQMELIDMWYNLYMERKG